MPPTITSVTPTIGLTGGLTLVDVEGSGFRLPPVPPSGRPSGLLRPTVEVLVGGRPASNVQVLASNRLSLLTPSHDAGTVEMVLRNLDDSGVPLPGEAVTRPSAFTFALPRLSVEGDLTRLVRVLMRELKRQIHPNVSLTVQTDFDGSTEDELNLTELAALPGLVLAGPELAESRLYSLNEPRELTAVDGVSLRPRAPYTVDLEFTLVGVADHTTELLNLVATTLQFFRRNKYLTLERDPSTASAGVVRYELDLLRDGVRVTSQPNESNVRSFSGSFVVRGFDVEDLAGAERVFALDEVLFEPSTQLAPTLPVGRHPGGRLCP